MEKIFIQIASYRDPELLPTIKNCLENAKHPERLFFAICWQHDYKESLCEYKFDSRFKIIDIDYTKSKGVCWARNQLQNLWNGEKYTLQLDSHHRFIKNWDEICIDMIEDLKKDGYKKPLLTAYVPSYDPTNDPTSRINEPWQMKFDRFIPEGAVFFLPETIPNFNDLIKPVPARFFSAHFAFTLGEFTKEVPYDPEYYFHGEEISIAVRAFTHGYDLFHPHKLICWHEYTRKGRTKQWDDDKTWTDKNAKSHLKNRKLFEMDGEIRDIDFGIYGFGKERTLDDYEKYSGICFKKRAVQKYTLDNLIPPNPTILDKDEYNKSFLKIFKHCLDLQYDQVPEKDYDFWCVAFKNKDGKDLYRKDADRNEIVRMFKDPDKYCKIWREFDTETVPHSWIVWPHSVSKGWCEPITGVIGNKVS